MYTKNTNRHQTNYRTRTVFLPPELRELAGHRFTSVIEFIDPASPLAIVQEEGAEFGRRIDMDKGIFLDSFADMGKEMELVGRIVRYLATQPIAQHVGSASGD